MNKDAVSAVIGVILMLVIVLAIGAVAYIYLEDYYSEERREKVALEMMDSFNWTNFSYNDTNIFIDFKEIKYEELIQSEGDGWYSIPVDFIRGNRELFTERGYFNIDTKEFYIRLELVNYWFYFFFTIKLY